MTDQTRLNEIRARVEAATPGPWRVIDTEHMIEGTPDQSIPCLHIVKPEDEEGDNEHGFYFAEAEIITEMDANLVDATFIAHARQDIPDLLAEVGRLSAERDEYRRALRYLVGNEWEESAGDTLSEKAMSTVIDRQAAELSRLRAVIEEARDEIELMYDSGTMQHGSQINVLAILDRGLKGAGE